MQQKYHDVRELIYERGEDRSDPRIWSYPGEMATAWSGQDADEQFLTYFGEDATPEIVAETRMMDNLGVSAFIKSMAPKKYEGTVEIVAAEAAPCPEEPEGPTTPLRLHLPKDRKGKDKLPVLMFIYGAGYMFEYGMFDVEASIYANELDCAVLVPSYRSYPEDIFPAQLNNLHAAYLWLTENADKYGLDGENVVVLGNSFGGLLALAFGHRLARCSGIPLLRGIVAVAPVVDDRGFGTSSYIYWKGAAQPSPYAYQLCWEAYLGYGNAGISALTPEAFPNHMTVDEAKQMPPVAIYVNESDCQRDVQIQYAQKLLDAGIFCSLHEWGGTKHGPLLTTQIVTSEDPYIKRYARNILEDIRSFMDFDLRRQKIITELDGEYVPPAERSIV